MRDRGQLLDVRYVELWVAKGLGVNRARFAGDRGAQPVEIVGVHEFHCDAQARPRVVEEVVGAAVERSRGADLIAGGGQGSQRQRLSSLTRRCRKGGSAAFKSCYALLKDIRGRIHDARVNVAELLQSEE